jgi:hypothetical protein
MTTSEIHPADPDLRRLTYWLAPALLLAGATAIWLLHGWLDGVETEVSLDAMLLAFAGLAVVVATAGLTLGWMLWREAGVILAEDRYPASDMRTLRDVPVLRGSHARRWAQRLRAGAAGSLVFALLLVAWALWTIRAVQ